MAGTLWQARCDRHYVTRWKLICDKVTSIMWQGWAVPSSVSAIVTWTFLFDLGLLQVGAGLVWFSKILLRAFVFWMFLYVFWPGGSVSGKVSYHCPWDCFFKNKFWTPPCVSVYMTEMLTKYLNWRRVARWLLCKISYFQTCFLIAKRILFEASDPCVKKSFQNSWR